MQSKSGWGQVAAQVGAGVVIGAILGVGGTIYLQGQKIATLESQVEQLKSTRPAPADSEGSSADAPASPGSSEGQATGTGAQRPTNVALTAAAWDALNGEDYSEAVAKATECIREFRASADREQSRLENGGVPLPPTGKVSEAVKQAVLARAMLNDVGTCYYIVGRSAEHLNQNDNARSAYASAIRYRYARCWDPQGWFWSPADAARDRLAVLE